MDDTVDIGILSKDFVQCLFVCDIDMVEVWPFAAEQLDAVEGDFGGVVETVDDHDFVAMLEESERGEGSDVTGSSAPFNVSMDSRAPGAKMAGQMKSQPSHAFGVGAVKHGNRGLTQ